MRKVHGLCGLVVLLGCATVPTAGGPSVTTTPVNFKMPTIASVDPGKENQERDGVRVIASAMPFRLERVVRTEYRPVRSTLILGNQAPVDRRVISIPDIQPEQLVFKIRINNRLPRVLRLAGTVVAFQVAGRNVNVPQDRYADFVNGIVLPQQETELELRGPSLLELAGSDLNGLAGDSATVAVLLFDIVTATDAAGNPTRRSNFEFYYRFTLPMHADQYETTTTRLSVTSELYSMVQQRQGADATRWVAVPELDCLPNCR